ncbi:MAG: hypothetical protein IPP25_06165 [Saprospiraceae bacterium]|nr:hypothetical protein [Candidatus Opimibacter skivensis]
MKTLILTILVFSFSFGLQGQNVAIELNLPIAWPGLDNTLTIVVEGIACKHLYVNTDNGSIKRRDTDCRFNYIPKKVGEGYFFIYNTMHNDTVLIEKRRIVVRRWPDQPAEFAGKISGIISLSEFRAQSGVLARISGFDMAGNHEVTSYEIKVIRNGEVILTLNNTGGRFEPDNSRKLGIVQGSDEILFENIMAKLPGEETPRKLNDIRIKIQI